MNPMAMTQVEKFEFENQNIEITLLTAKYYKDLAAWERKLSEFHANRASFQSPGLRMSDDEVQLVEEASLLVHNYLSDRQALLTRCNNAGLTTISSN